MIEIPKEGLIIKLCKATEVVNGMISYIQKPTGKACIYLVGRRCCFGGECDAKPYVIKPVEEK